MSILENTILHHCSINNWIIDKNKTKCCNLHFSTLLKLHLCQEYRFKISGYFDGDGGGGAGEEDWCKWKNVLYVIKSVSK